MAPAPPAPNAPGPSFAAFARAARRVPRLDPARERQLARRSAGGDLEARRALVQSELRLVLFHASRLRGSAAAPEDLVQDGVLGLLRAAERFDPDRGVRFASFASDWVRHAIGDSARRAGTTASLPASDARRAARLRRLDAEGTGDGAAAAALGLPPSRLAALRAASTGAWSLDAPAGTDGSTLGERLAGDDDEALLDGLARRDLRRAVRDLVGVLAPRERAVLAQRFGLGGPVRTHEQIGADLGISAERVRQILARALARLREDPGLRAHVTGEPA